MLYLVCYDIADDRRRERIASALLDYGSRIQESVFAAHLDGELYERMTGRIQKLIDAGADRVHVIRLCAPCESGVVALGLADVKKDAAFWVL